MARVPNRSDDLARPRSRQGKHKGYEVTQGAARAVEVPSANPEWCPVAVSLWEAAQASGQADYYQQTDWAVLYLTLDQITYLYEQSRRSPEFLKAVYSALGALMFTEADRRKANVELVTASAKETSDAVVAVMDDYKKSLGIKD